MTPHVTLLFGLLALAAAGDSDTVRIDFRGKPLDARHFAKVVGTKVIDDEHIRIDDGGLRITLADPATPLGEYGIQAKYRIKGDFEITTSYELLKAEAGLAPRVGVTVYLRTAGRDEHSIMLGRYNLRDGGGDYMATRGVTVQGRRQFSGSTSPTQATSGKLRLVRRGSELTCQAADAGSDAFVTVDRQPDFGAEDVIFFRLAGQRNGRREATIDARFLDLEIRSPETFTADANPVALDPGLLQTPPAKPPLTGGWLVAAEISVLLVLILLVALWRRKRNRDQTTTQEAKASAVAAREFTPRRRRWLVVACMTIAVIVLLVAVVGYFAPPDPVAAAARRLQVGQAFDIHEVQRRADDSYAVQWDAKKGECIFWAAGELWIVTVTDDRISKITHSPDNGPFLERTRRTLERKFRQIGRLFR